MKSLLYRGTVSHRRLGVVPHTFDYPLYFFGFDLAELPQLSRTLHLFSYNRGNVLSLRDRDYLVDTPGSLSDKLDYILGSPPGEMRAGSVRLVTCARFCNYVFNPVSFYLVLDADERLERVVAEVNNTFGDRHLYRLDKLESTGPNAYRARHAKEFHVSPFNDMQGEYLFTFQLDPDQLSIGVDMIKQGQTVFQAGLAGTPLPLTNGSIARTLLRYPVTAALTTPRIIAQAARLYYRKRLRVFHRPEPEHPMTIRRRAV